MSLLKSETSVWQHLALQPPFGFFTGKMGVLQGELGHSTMAPLSINDWMTGAMPSTASGLGGYCLLKGLNFGCTTGSSTFNISKIKFAHSPQLFRYH